MNTDDAEFTFTLIIKFCLEAGERGVPGILAAQ